MYLMCSPDGPEIRIIGISKDFETLVDKNIMKKEVTHSVQGNSQANPEQVIITIFHSQIQGNNPRDSKNQKEKIVVLEESRGFLFVMVFM